jgi:hypothetical protein
MPFGGRTGCPDGEAESQSRTKRVGVRDVEAVGLLELGTPVQ